MSLDAFTVRLLDECLADLGHIVRQAGSETFSEESFRTLANRMRANLKRLRADAEGEPAFELTDAGFAAGVQRASDLLAQRGWTPTRIYDAPRVIDGHLAVLDGGLEDGAAR